MMSVTDNGLGIDIERHADKLFGLNKTFHRHKDAKGVGLYLTKTQVVAMGGIIYIESEVGVGSNFIIKF
jgi:signal transduction histidine kinase